MASRLTHIYKHTHTHTDVHTHTILAVFHPLTDLDRAAAVVLCFGVSKPIDTV